MTKNSLANQIGIDGNDIVSIEKSCITCANKGQTLNSQIPQIMKLFKIACLSYNPSPVTFDNKSFSRNELIEAQGYLLFLAIQ